MVENIDENFEMQDSNVGSLSTPSTAGALRIGGLVLIKDRPCKVVEMSTAKTGKHGHAKCTYTGIDIFTGKKLVDSVPSTHAVDIPNTYRSEYTFIGFTSDGFLTLMGADGTTREDIKINEEQEDDKKILERINTMQEEGKSFTCTVLKCMNEEKITDLKESN